MKKPKSGLKWLILGVVLLVAVIVSIGTFKYLNNDYTKDRKSDRQDDKLQEKEVTEKDNNNFDEITSEKKTENILEEPSKIIESNNSSENVTTSNPKKPVNNEIKNQTQEEQNIQKEPSTQIENENKVIDIPKEETPKPSEPQIDPEYERLKAQAVFSTREECNNVSNEIYGATIRNMACNTVAYNGELIGYSLRIVYNDGTSEYYKR